MAARVLGDYLRMIKFSHTIFALPFAGIAFLLAVPGSGLVTEGQPSLRFYLLIVQVVVSMAALRSAAMGFNRLVDRQIDAANPRTAIREIPAGAITVSNARWFVLVSLFVFLVTAVTINPLCGILAPFAVVFVLGYSYAKRFTMFCHLFLGAAIGIAPTATWVAVRGHLGWEVLLDPVPLLWSAGLALYIAGFDTLYSCQDVEFDRRHGLHSFPARLGIPRALWIARGAHVLALALFLLAGQRSGAGAGFMAAALVVAALFLAEHLLVRADRLTHIPIAFFHVNASISTVLFLGLLIDTIVRGSL